MSENEAPERGTRPVTVDDVRELMAATTPHFAPQLAGRLRRLVKTLDPTDPARRLAEQEISRLALIAVGGEERGSKMPNEQRVN